MKIVDLMLCAKPLIFENQDEQFRYSILGTCFVVSFRGGLYAVTAKHCFDGRERTSVRIRMIPGDLTWLPIRAIHTLGGDGDFCDLAIVDFNASILPKGIAQPPQCLRLELPASSLQTPADGALLALVGYPASSNCIDYESFELRTQGFSADGRCTGPAEEEHCSIMRFNKLEPVEHLNGMSGSPVFQFEEIRDGVYRHSFTGVLIRGSKQSNSGRFINAEVVIRALLELRRHGH
jgi:hypothetical protein